MKKFKKNSSLNNSLVLHISQQKNEPSWMRDFRMHALETFEHKHMPSWGPNLSELNTTDLQYYLKPTTKTHASWDDVPEHIKTTFDILGIPQAERKLLAGVGAQFDSEMIYKGLKETWRDQGVIFCSMDQAVAHHPELVKKYFASVVPPNDNKFAALNSAVWSGGSFVYVPQGIKIDMPLQTYFRINAQQFGQFERTLVIAEPGSFVHYVEGCSAPVYSTSSLHAAVVELVALPGSHIRYTTIQNWAGNVYNLVTKRAIAKKDARVEWIDGNFGSKITMKYPSVVLQEEGAKSQLISIAVTGKNQQHDTGGKIIHQAPRTSSNIIAKSISKDGGQSSYRGLVKVVKDAHDVSSHVQCDALILDDHSRSDTYPLVDVHENNVDVGHEASVQHINDGQLRYLMSRGLTNQQARAMMVNGFIDVFVNELPMEYAVEINRLIVHEMEGSIG